MARNRPAAGEDHGLGIGAMISSHFFAGIENLWSLLDQRVLHALQDRKLRGDSARQNDDLAQSDSRVGGDGMAQPEQSTGAVP